MSSLGNWPSSSLFSDEERAVLEYAEAMTLSDKTVTDELFENLQSHFSEAQIVELTAGIAMENMRSKFNPTLNIESQGFCLLKNTQNSQAE
ncbi:MAG: hypothetical protein AAF387_13220 [Pseudomonadota bacterium]